MNQLIRNMVPNALSAARIALGLAFPFLPAEWRVWVVVAAAASDALDGLSARLLAAESNAGRLLDPVADKVFVLCVLATLLVEGVLHPLWLLGLAVRDIVVLAGLAYTIARRQWAKGRKMRPTWLGKCTTAAQFAIFFVVAGWHEAPIWLLVPAVLLSAAAAVDYARWAVVTPRGY